MKSYCPSLEWMLPYLYVYFVYLPFIQHKKVIENMYAIFLVILRNCLPKEIILDIRLLRIFKYAYLVQI